MIDPTENDIGRVFVYSGDPDGRIGIVTAVFSREYLNQRNFRGNLVQFRFLDSDGETLFYANPDHLDWWSKRASASGTPSTPISGPRGSRTGG